MDPAEGSSAVVSATVTDLPSSSNLLDFFSLWGLSCRGFIELRAEIVIRLPPFKTPSAKGGVRRQRHEAPDCNIDDKRQPGKRPGRVQLDSHCRNAEFCSVFVHAALRLR